MEIDKPKSKEPQLQNLEKNLSHLEISVSSFIFDFEKKKKFTYFILKCKYTKNIKWEVKRRYKQFERLVADLKRSFINIPSLPGKSLFTITKEAKLEKRREGLDEFVQSILPREEMFCHPHFYNFFMIAQHVPFLCSNFPIPIGKIFNTESMGYRDAHISKEGELAILASHPIFVTDRFDSYFSNFFSRSKAKTPAIKTTNSVEKSVGVVEIRRRVGLSEVEKMLKSRKGNNQHELIELEMEEDDLQIDSSKKMEEDADGLSYFNYVRVEEKGFKSQVIALTWSREMKKIMVGLDSGDVFVYKYDTQESIDFGSEVSFPKAHSKRVMRFVLDEKRNFMYSVGEDKKLVTYDLSEGKIIDRMTLPAVKPTNLIYHKKNQVGVISDKDGSLYVVNLSKNHPQLLQKIDGKVKGPIKGMCEVFSKNVFIIASNSDGIIKAFHNKNISDPNCVFSCVLRIQGPPGPRCLFYWEKRKELWVGYSKGVVSVFSNISFEGNEMIEDPHVIESPVCEYIISNTSFSGFAP